jgi:hypothetical protein
LKTIRNSKGELYSYKFDNEESHVALEVITTRLDGRIGNMESKLEDIKNALNKFITECNDNKGEINIIKSGVNLSYKVFGAAIAVLGVVAAFLALRGH